MQIQLSKRMEAFQPSIFSELAAYKQQKITSGHHMIDLSIGSPDLPPPPFVMAALAQSASEERSYGYTLSGTAEFHEAVAFYYEQQQGVALDTKHEILMLMGSQDGLVHLPMAFADPGDLILVPDPGYTAYATGIAMAGAEPYFMPLRKENGFLPDLDAIPADIADKAKLMILSFPGNPVPAMATEAFFAEVVAFAKKHHIIVLHDFAYSELYYDGNKPLSFLSVPGAKEVGAEMNSLSKSFNLAGCRIGYLVGNPAIVKAVGQMKSNLDYGVFLPIQKAAALALREGAQFSEESRRTYQSRRDLFVDGLAALGWQVDKPAGSMFVWAEVPQGWTSTAFAYALMDRAHVVVTPGVAFGPAGEGYVRMALVQDETGISRVLENLKNSGIFATETQECL
ncbi:LL-diaminopimelate aminotransferase [Ectobacillus ponti]|uniref:Aminotransferase n=1 Tax=Ectobacillus ponti TaxID=2961894 RepID=A0AA41XEQ6_9BACI|nr:LL-diaminopimelate aminotransferase [Ectobacillus ponti]MCP8970741.1 LL-diaminopimelate aminotransferase [Ectobacillus ponti]